MSKCKQNGRKARAENGHGLEPRGLLPKEEQGGKRRKRDRPARDQRELDRGIHVRRRVKDEKITGVVAKRKGGGKQKRPPRKKRAEPLPTAVSTWTEAGGEQEGGKGGRQG